MNRDDLLRALVLHAASGKLDLKQVFPAVRDLVGGGAPPVADATLIDALLEHEAAPFQALAAQLGEIRRKEAAKHHALRKSRQPVPQSLREGLSDLPLDAPLQWKTVEDAVGRLRTALQFLTDRCFLAARKEQAPALAAGVERRYEAAAQEALRDESLWDPSRLLELAAAPEVPETVRELVRKKSETSGAAYLGTLAASYAQAATREERSRLLDLLCTWPADAAASTLAGMELEPWARERAAMILTLRFGQGGRSTWDAWRGWLRATDAARLGSARTLKVLTQRRPAAILHLWYSHQPEADPDALGRLESECVQALGGVTVDDVLERWSSEVSREEWRALTGQAAPREEIIIAEEEVEEPAPAPRPQAAPRPPPPPPKPVKPPAPSVWEVHLKPFFLANWYMVAGVVMVVVGASLLAYYTWDKHWLIRYSLMPSLLGAFTAALAGMGGWIERKDAQFKGTAAVLRAAAIGLLPVNFMAVALLANDAHVLPAQKAVAAPVMGLIYLALFGWGLRKWCAAVHPSLGGPLGGTLLFLNALVMLGSFPHKHLLPAVGAGFYVGFLALAASAVWFAKRVLTADLGKEKRVVWFFGAALAVTFVQVFAWVHGSLHHLPRPHAYAPMVVLTGWLVLFMERRTLELRGDAGRLGAESFLGYALILLGVMLGLGQEGMRIITFVLAGAVWIYQSLPRKQALHSWIGLTFLALAGASVGAIRSFPHPWIPAVGIGTALVMGALAAFFRREETLSRAAAGMQAAVLVLSVIVTVLAQAHYHSPPLATAGALAAIAALFGWRAARDGKLAWVHTAMVVLALALPYLTWPIRPSMLVGGLAVLSFLWIAAAAAVPAPLLRNARSTVLWIYGVLAVACMALRASLHAPPDPAWIDIGGPALMMAALVFAAGYSRSLIPSAMAMAVGVILLPVIRDRLKVIFPHWGWGSGLGSAAAAVAFLLSAFALRNWPRLRSLGEGDKYLGREPFPLRRLDATLFTWPLLASALFLAVKVDTWNFLHNLAGRGVTERVAIALGLTGVFWTLLAVWVRSNKVAPAGTYAGLLWMTVALAFGLKQGGSDGVLIGAGIFQALFFFYRFVLERRAAWAAGLLTQPTRQFLRAASVILSIGLILALSLAESLASLRWVALLAAAHLVWHGLSSRRLVFGGVLVPLAWAALLAWTAPGGGPLLERLGLEKSLAPTLWLLLGVQLFQAALELRKPFYEFLKPVVIPFQALAAALSVGLGVAAVLQWVPAAHLLLLAAVVLLTARALTSGPLALLGLLVSYVWVHAGVETGRVGLLLSPWHASLLALSLALLGHFGGRFRRVLSGPFTPDSMKRAVAPWLFIPAGAIACAVTLYHAIDPVLRERPVQLWAPYVGALTIGVIAFSTRRLPLYHLAGALLSLGNVHLVRVFGGEFLRSHGLTEIHLICLGLALTLLQGSLVRRMVRSEDLARMAARASLAFAGLVLALLSANYLVHPNLESIGAFRFGASGVMALLAGWYFRRAARRPSPGEESAAAFCEGFYHFGVTMAIWCAALMVPVLRHPMTAILGLGLPVLYFYARAESGRSARYRNSAATMGFLVLALYVLRPIFQLILFPETPFTTTFYHQNSPCVFVLGLVLLRLRALGGTSWLAFYGGLAVMAATYFALTALPGLSPFGHPVESAGCAIALAHFFTLASVQRSPLRTAIQRLAGVDGPGWLSLRRPWGVCLLAASQGMALWGMLDFERRPLMVAPLLLGAASVWVHQGVLRGSKVYPLVARVQILAALHLGFVVQSYLPAEHVVWALLVVWGAYLALDAWVGVEEVGRHAAAFAVLTMAHVFHHGPGSVVGLWAFAALAALAAATPRRSRSWEAALLPWAPAWLVWFSQGPLGAWQVLATAAAVLATGWSAKALPDLPARAKPRLCDHALGWLRSRAEAVHLGTLAVAFLATGAVQALHFGRAFEARELALIEGLYAALFTGWFLVGRARKEMGAYFLLQACVLGAFLVVRQQLLLTGRGWHEAYDVWASLAAFFGIVGALQLLDRQPREVLIPLRVSLAALPVFSVSWVTLHHLGTDLGLIVIGLHSAAFAYLGREDRESPYHLVAIGGFIAFVMLLFWSKLHLRVAYAYVVPVGVGVLVLLQLFQKRVVAEVRNGVRAVTLLAMVGSAGYHALIDDKLPLAHHLSVVLICLAAMALGGLLRVRLYLALGFGALMVDLAVLFMKAVGHMELRAQMIIVGSAVLAIGIGLVFGAIYYKTHQEEIAGWLGRWRLRFSGWE